MKPFIAGLCECGHQMNHHSYNKYGCLKIVKKKGRPYRCICKKAVEVTE